MLRIHELRLTRVNAKEFSVEKLDIVLAKLRRTPDYSRRWIVFIGDVVDRGTDPKGAIDRLLTESGLRKRCTAGTFAPLRAESLALAHLPPVVEHVRRLAEAGCSGNEIMAISGHATMKELVRYTAAADQARLARNAMVRTMAAKPTTT